MALPLLNVSSFDLTLPSSGKKIKYRSMLVGEEKILAIAKNSEDDTTILNAIKQVIKNCSLDTADPEELALVDFEYLFLHIRMKSKGEISDVKIPCQGADCKHKIEVAIDLETFKIKEASVPDKIELTDTIGIVMKPPTLDVMKFLSKKGEDYNQTLSVVIECIDFVYDGEELTYPKDLKKDEMLTFIDGLSTKQMKKVTSYLEGLPKIYFDLEYTCPECKTVNTRTVEGIDNFF